MRRLLKAPKCIPPEAFLQMKVSEFSLRVFEAIFIDIMDIYLIMFSNALSGRAFYRPQFASGPRSTQGNFFLNGSRRLVSGAKCMSRIIEEDGPALASANRLSTIQMNQEQPPSCPTKHSGKTTPKSHAQTNGWSNSGGVGRYVFDEVLFYFGLDID